MDIATLIAACPYPVSDATGVGNAVAWLAEAEAFALASEPKDIPNRHTIINLSEIYFTNIKLSSVDYTSINNDLKHIKDLYSAVVAITPTP